MGNAWEDEAAVQARCMRCTDGDAVVLRRGECIALAWGGRERNQIDARCGAGVSLRETLFHAVVPDSGGGVFGKDREGGSGGLQIGVTSVRWRDEYGVYEMLLRVSRDSRDSEWLAVV